MTREATPRERELAVRVALGPPYAPLGYEDDPEPIGPPLPGEPDMRPYRGIDFSTDPVIEITVQPEEVPSGHWASPVWLHWGRKTDGK